MIDFNNNIYLGVASPDMERDLSNYYTKAQTRALVDTKQDIITGAATTITEDNLTTNRAVISNASGKVAVSNVTSTELGYLSGVTSGVQTQLDNKASTSLDNLSADGQMVIDSQNGTISNCILEIPQNIKLTLENNVLTLKAGSVLTRTGETYATVTVTEDKTSTYSNNGKYYIIVTADGTLYNWWSFDELGSGSTLPVDNTNYNYFFLTTNKRLYLYGENGWYIWRESIQCYPLGIIEVTNGVASFAKDSNGRDMIFNGAGFIGHHAFVYPNVKALTADGLNSDGTLKSKIGISSSLTIIEITTASTTRIGVLVANGNVSGLVGGYYEYDVLPSTPPSKYTLYYEKSTNNTFEYYNNSYHKYRETKLYNISSVSSSGNISITDFAIRQPVRTATVEMLNSALEDKQADLTTVSGYDATTTQVLKNINGVLTWVTEE